MKIAVCVRQVPDTETKIKTTADGANIDLSGIKWVINPYDEHAIEESIKIRDANPGSTIQVFSVGPKARVSEALRTALAMGADEATAIDAADFQDSTLIAKALAGAMKKTGPYDLVLTGKQAIDDNSSSVSQMVAEFLEIAHLTVVSKMSLSNGQLTCEREVEGGKKEIFQVNLPAVVGANKGLNTPRYASLPGIMKAKKKTIAEISLSDLGVSAADGKSKFSGLKMPPQKPAVKMLSGDAKAQATQLTQLLREEAKVI
jgi:electron transfer flavoprotein beta subunit